MKKDTKYKMTKNGLIIETTDIEVVKQLLKDGWKIKVSNFGELI